MSKHWVHFLDNGNKIFVNSIVKLLSEHHLLTKEHKETIDSEEDYDEIKNILYENYLKSNPNDDIITVLVQISSRVLGDIHEEIKYKKLQDGSYRKIQ